MRALVANIFKFDSWSRMPDTIWAYISMFLIGLCVSYALTFIDYRLGFLLMGGMIGGAITLVCLFNTKAGFFISTALGFFMFYLKRMTDDEVPFGVAVDVLIAVTFIGSYYKKKLGGTSAWAHFANPITYLHLINLAFLLIQLFNPSMFSVEGWLFTTRKFFNFVMIYFTALNIFNSKKDIMDFLKLWLILAAFAGFYGCFQQWHGLFGFEEHWVTSDPVRYRLYFQGGDIRKFSILSDPTAYGCLMATSIIFAIVLLLNTGNKKHRKMLLAGILFMALGMAYSGTRTAYIMIPAGLVLFAIMTITNRKTLLFIIGFVMFFSVLIFGPFHSNGTVNRIRSAFEFSDDESLDVRDKNRAFIQPYIWDHPLGGGVSTSGVQGITYNPGHPLAGFPPDSGYLRSALETGWVGLALTCFTFFVLLYLGVKNYYLSRNRETRIIYVGIVASLYAYVVANYAQVAIGQTPGAFFFYAAGAIIIRLRSFETANPNTDNNNLKPILK